MATAVLTRLSSLGARTPTLGILSFKGSIVCATFELPWVQNLVKVSCIPNGVYPCSLAQDVRTSGGMLIPQTYRVLKVPRRSGIMFHVGNTVEDTEGCILVGTAFGVDNGTLAIRYSRKAFQRLLEVTRSLPEFDLEIRSINDS